MTKLSSVVTVDGHGPNADHEMADDSTVATPPVGMKDFTQDYELVSKTIRFKFSPYDHRRVGSIQPSEVHHHAAAVFRTCLSKEKAPCMKIPTFKFVLSSPCMDFQGRRVGTRAYSLEVPTHHSQHMINAFLKDEATSSTKDFASYRMRRRHPEAFQGAIRFQNFLLSNQHIVVLNNVGPDAMFYLSKRIKAIYGVHDVSHHATY